MTREQPFHLGFEPPKYWPRFSPRTQRWISYVFLVVVIVESSSLFFQMLKAYQTQSVNDLDITAFSLLFFTNLYWIVYAAFVMYDIPILVSGILYVTFSGAILAAIMMYS